jgi:hypothetical protein
MISILFGLFDMVSPPSPPVDILYPSLIELYALINSISFSFKSCRSSVWYNISQFIESNPYLFIAFVNFVL